MQQIDVGMDDIEFVRPAANLLQHHDLVRQVVLDCRVEPQGNARARHQFAVGNTVAAGEKCDLMALTDKLVRQIRNGSLCSPIELRGNAFGKRGDLGDLRRKSFSNEQRVNIWNQPAFSKGCGAVIRCKTRSEAARSVLQSKSCIGPDC
ncbi:hypothetical protein AOG23_23465 [Rhizobium acidisoli]|nr:hypothetical protein AOG23_23465 [Rhizobium acidisoli]